MQVEAVLSRALDQAEVQANYRTTVLSNEGRVPGFDVVLWRRAPAVEEVKAPPAAMRQAG